MWLFVCRSIEGENSMNSVLSIKLMRWRRRQRRLLPVASDPDGGQALWLRMQAIRCDGVESVTMTSRTALWPVSPIRL